MLTILPLFTIVMIVAFLAFCLVAAKEFNQMLNRDMAAANAAVSNASVNVHVTTQPSNSDLLFQKVDDLNKRLTISEFKYKKLARSLNSANNKIAEVSLNRDRAKDVKPNSGKRVDRFYGVPARKEERLLNVVTPTSHSLSALDVAISGMVGRISVIPYSMGYQPTYFLDLLAKSMLIKPEYYNKFTEEQLRKAYFTLMGKGIEAPSVIIECLNITAEERKFDQSKIKTTT